MSISFGIDENGKFFFDSLSIRYTTEVEPTDAERPALDQILAAVEDVASDIRLYRHSENYLSICVLAPEYDFCRLKASERALWFSVDMWGSPFVKDARLSSVQNKNQRHWKIKLSRVDDIAAYSDILLEAAQRNIKNAEV